ncbi:MAG TPA: hypothetical protein VE028_00255 [Nitratidesulfovibrio sp.]|nr:hypothetical protein [Nitratidesulfovibrio sp.]
MRCEVTFAVPTPEHVQTVAGALRAADRAELAALWGGDPQAVLEVSVLDSMMAGEVFTALNAEGAPFALFGVCHGANWLNWSGSCVWMVGTDEVANHGRALLWHGRRFVQAWVTAYGLLGGFVHVRHDAAVRTLSRLGFHVNPDGAVLLGPPGQGAEPFLPFHLAPGEA